MAVPAEAVSAVGERFSLRRRLGHGAFASVYLALHRLTQCAYRPNQESGIHGKLTNAGTMVAIFRQKEEKIKRATNGECEVLLFIEYDMSRGECKELAQHPLADTCAYRPRILMLCGVYMAFLLTGCSVSLLEFCFCCFSVAWPCSSLRLQLCSLLV